MADFAPNYTARYRVRYRVHGLVHTMQMRFERGNPSTPADGAAFFTDFLTALAPSLFSDFAILGADYAGADSDVFLPAGALPVVTGLSVAVGDESYKPLYASFVGRSVLGHRAVMFVYGWVNSPTAADNTANDWRVLSGENSAVADAVAVLNGATANNVVANDNEAASWYPYANIGMNSHYQRKARRG